MHFPKSCEVSEDEKKLIFLRKINADFCGSFYFLPENAFGAETGASHPERLWLTAFFLAKKALAGPGQSQTFPVSTLGMVPESAAPCRKGPKFALSALALSQSGGSPEAHNNTP
jgi:hypothetical protein